MPFVPLYHFYPLEGFGKVKHRYNCVNLTNVGLIHNGSYKHLTGSKFASYHIITKKLVSSLY